MIVTIEINERKFRVETNDPLPIAIPLDFYGAQPNAYDVARAFSKPCAAGAVVGDTRKGGSCNFEQITLIPHCNGTHTESVGHITHERISINDCLCDAFSPAILISVTPESAAETSDSYAVELNENDKLITRKALELSMKSLSDESPKSKVQSPKSLIVRTLPNNQSKPAQTYADEIPPFFSTEAMEFMNEIGVRHLLCDLPSIDRLYDDGKLSNHRKFWNVAQGSFEISDETSINKTITELIYAPDEIADGAYLLNLQIAPFVADAAPSRPILFKLL